MLEVGIGRSILNQQEKKLASGGVCGVLVELFVDPFSCVGVVVDILFLIGGASGWSVPTVVMGAACLNHYKGQYVIHVGELFGDTLSM